MYENSIKVPAIASHPGRIPEGYVQNAMVSVYDFMPTLLDYLDLPLPEGRNLPGESYLPALLGEDDAGRDNVIIYDEYGSTRMIRTRDWKYVHRYPDGPNELYDLSSDLDERNNLIGDPAQKNRISEMKRTMEDWFAEYVDPDRDGLKYDVTGSGQMRPVGKHWDNEVEPFAQ
jgi:arylsulfatase A-like enzyme